jgi:hydroxymethylglutaryl-CoA reductase (NADPH)
MSANRQKIQNLLARIPEINAQTFASRFSSHFEVPAPTLKHASRLTAKRVEDNWSILKKHTSLDKNDQDQLLDPGTLQCIERYSRNIENCIGTLKIPIGVAGPLRINGLFAAGDYYIPLVTTEAALVASYHRGSRLITAAGGCRALLHDNMVTRSPGFIFQNLTEVGQFVLWAMQHYDDFFEAASQTSHYGRLTDMRITLDGNHVYMNLDYFTGEAAGQNMVTIATEAILKWILLNTPIQPRQTFVEANFSGDKKASALSFMSVRGKKVTAEILLSETLILKYLHTTPREMATYWQMAAIGGIMSGTIGVQGHFANGLAAMYLATGQDAACVSESSVGITRMEVTDENALYATVTLPNIIVGAIGGGTALPSQAVGLKMLALPGDTQALALAEICACLCLAGELSIIGALCANDFASAHQKRARKEAK